MLDDLDLFRYAYYSPQRLCFFTKVRQENRMTFIDTSASLLRCVFALTLAAFLVVLSMQSLEQLDLFRYAYYSPQRLCFFTKIRKENRMTFIDTSASLLRCVFALTLAAFLVVLSMNIRSCALFRGNHTLSLEHLILLMLSTFFGRSHSIPGAQASAYRSLAVVSWMLGMFFLGNYVQSSITAIRVAPRALPPIRTLDQLRPYAENCVLSACVDKLWADILLQMHGMLSEVDFPMSRMVLVCKDMQYGDDSRCYQEALRSTHFALSSCNDEEVTVASQLGLVPSDNICTFLQVAAIHKFNPIR
ncbi:hypothetical protein HPB50_019782 [Hyalomma asiaticum]|uniref:Uncharacterized protein n=1 Tax=Hyalomma asiaticum TaxID=266040 RepID=A0ACB7SRB5_HYAAI|nr:hypothetical protein HPB50_019782 [Hyalomma asiaticum]